MLNIMKLLGTPTTILALQHYSMVVGEVEGRTLIG